MQNRTLNQFQSPGSVVGVRPQTNGEPGRVASGPLPVVTSVRDHVLPIPSPYYDSLGSNPYLDPIQSERGIPNSFHVNSDPRRQTNLSEPEISDLRSFGAHAGKPIQNKYGLGVRLLEKTPRNSNSEYESKSGNRPQLGSDDFTRGDYRSGVTEHRMYTPVKTSNRSSENEKVVKTTTIQTVQGANYTSPAPYNLFGVDKGKGGVVGGQAPRPFTGQPQSQTYVQGQVYVQAQGEGRGSNPGSTHNVVTVHSQNKIQIPPVAPGQPSFIKTETQNGAVQRFEQKIEQIRSVGTPITQGSLASQLQNAQAQQGASAQVISQYQTGSNAHVYAVTGMGGLASGQVITQIQAQSGSQAQASGQGQGARAGQQVTIQTQTIRQPASQTTVTHTKTQYTNPPQNPPSVVNIQSAQNYGRQSAPSGQGPNAQPNPQGSGSLPQGYNSPTVNQEQIREILWLNEGRVSEDALFKRDIDRMEVPSQRQIVSNQGSSQNINITQTKTQIQQAPGQPAGQVKPLPQPQGYPQYQGQVTSQPSTPQTPFQAYSQAHNQHSVQSQTTIQTPTFNAELLQSPPANKVHLSQFASPQSDQGAAVAALQAQAKISEYQAQINAAKVQKEIAESEARAAQSRAQEAEAQAKAKAAKAQAEAAQVIALAESQAQVIAESQAAAALKAAHSRLTELSQVSGEILKLTLEGVGSYEGGVRNNTMHGYGKLLDSKGRLVYEGEFVNNAFEGLGVLYNHKDTGEHIETWSGSTVPENWIRFEGLFHDSKKSGNGTLFYSDGSQFVGDFEADVAYGYGVLRLTSGEIVKGFWKNNALVTRN